MRNRIDIRKRQSAAFAMALELLEMMIDEQLDEVDENTELPIYVNIHGFAKDHPMLPEIIAEKYRSEGKFDVLVCHDDNGQIELEIG